MISSNSEHLSNDFNIAGTKVCLQTEKKHFIQLTALLLSLTLSIILFLSLLIHPPRGHLLKELPIKISMHIVSLSSELHISPL